MNMNRAITNLLLRSPYYGYILSSLNIISDVSVDSLKVSIGPTIQLIYNPDWLDSLEDQQAYGAILHELLHLIFMHAFRRAGRDRVLWAIAGDLAVNEHISETMLPAQSMTVSKVKRILGIDIEQFKHADYYYEKLSEVTSHSPLPQSLMKSTMIIHFPNEQEMTVTMEEDEDLSELNRHAAKSKLEEITRQASAEGEIPGRLMGLMDGLYGALHVNWRRVLKQFLTGKGKIQSHKTVKRVSKRFDDMPGTKRHRGIEALVAIDESGSIGDEDIMRFYKELRIIKHSAKADIMTTRFDTDCTRPVPLGNFLKAQDRAKNGGTDFRPIFELAESMNRRIVIIFTDGDGTFPRTIKQQTLWVLTKQTDIPSPLGDTVYYSEG